LSEYTPSDPVCKTRKLYREFELDGEGAQLAIIVIAAWLVGEVIMPLFMVGAALVVAGVRIGAIGGSGQGHKLT